MYLADTNVVLDACFVPSSWSRQALHVLTARGMRVATTRRVVTEAKHRIVRYRTAARDSTEHLRRIDDFISDLGIDVIPDREGTSPNAIPPSDRFLWPTCVRPEVTLLTRDLPLLEAVQQCGAEVVCPLEIIGEGQPASRYAFGGVRPRAQSGTLYFHGYDRHWLTNIDTPVCLFHWGRDLIVDFMPAQNKWIVSGPAIARSVELCCREAACADVDRKIAVSWSGRGLYIRDSSELLPGHEPSVQTVQLTGNQATIGALPGRQASFSGTVQSVVMDDRPISREFWRSIKNKGHAFTPQPFDNDRLRSFLR